MTQLRVDLNKNSAYIIEQYQNGKSTNKLADEFKCNAGTIYLFLKENGIEIKKRKKFEGNLEDYEEKILNLYSSGLSIYKVSLELKLSEPSVKRILKKNKVKIQNSVTFDKDNLLKDKLIQVINLYNEGKNTTEISKIVGHSDSSVWRLLDDNGYDTRANIQEYEVDEDYFKVIDTPNKSYSLGFFFSDGNVTKNLRSARISIQEKDEHILWDMAKDMGYNGGLDRKPPKNERCQPQAGLHIYRKVFCEHLVDKGCMPKKSAIIRLPDKVPNYLMSHFIRGFFDGDGSIGNQGRGLYTSITSNEDFCLDVWEYFAKLGIEPTNYYPRKKGGRYGSLMFGRIKEAIAFLDHIYQDSDNSLRLKRKYDKYLEIKSKYANSTK